jgi:DNA-binding MarR family transcriptional regulator
MDKIAPAGEEDRIGVFAALRTTRAFKRRHMRFLQTQDDWNLVVEIGFHQEDGKPLTMKKLQLIGLVSVPSLQRRLRRLREGGIIVARRSAQDARLVELTLSPNIMRAFAKYSELIKSVHCGGA